MSRTETATLVGAMSTVLFASSMVPMLVRAARTRDVSSYSRGHLALGNVGNLAHTVYVVSLPPGPVWALHAFHTLVTLQMLVWHVLWNRVRRGGRRAGPAHRAARAPGPRGGGVEPLVEVVVASPGLGGARAWRRASKESRSSPRSWSSTSGSASSSHATW